MLLEYGLPDGSDGKESAYHAGDRRGAGSIPGLIPGSGRRRRAWQPTPAFLPGEYHGQKSLAGDSTWDCRVGHD